MKYIQNVAEIQILNRRINWKKVCFIFNVISYCTLLPRVEFQPF